MEEEPCNTRLALAIGGGVDGFFDHSTRGRGRQRKLPIGFSVLFPDPCAAGEEVVVLDRGEEGGWSTAEEEQGVNKIRLRSSTTEEKLGGAAADRVAGEAGGARKKLRLTREQSALLETIFRQHNMLTAMQKQELADRLKLRPRQVEVWFQNRRARTKLKQMEVDCEFLKRCCESLSDENMRLKKELRELRTTCRPAPFNACLPASWGAAATVSTVCASCDMGAVAAGGEAVVDGAAKHGGFHDCSVKDDSIAC